MADLRSVFGRYCSSHEQRGAELPADLLQHFRFMERVKLSQEFMAAQGNIARSIRQTRCYYEMVRARAEQVDGSGRVCEIGFNGGHSAVVFLSAVDAAANAAAVGMLYEGFDLGQIYTRRAMEAINGSSRISFRGLFPRRLRLTIGDSADTVPALLAQEPSIACDVLSLDGDHASRAIARDWAAFRSVVRPGSPILMDDVGRDFAARGDKSSISRGFFRHVLGTELELIGCVRLPGVADMNSRANRTMIASDGFCVAMALAPGGASSRSLMSNTARPVTSKRRA